ncbi:MAG: hypothetical protein JO108_20210 [Acidobacteriaceae bacterium]|nr:hypothetical protein [Acidobacteriaceae bacterium]
MNGQLGESGLTDEDVFEALDLCLECRACKTECPAGVDMASLKSEFLAKYWREHGTPLRARALGDVERVSAWGSRLAPLSNWVTASALGRRVNEAILKNDRRRSSPQWKRQTFAHWVRKNRRRGHKESNSVTLFNDTFMNHYEPEVGIAALESLERGGCDVNVVRPCCCGRPFISQGLLAEARERASTTVEQLFPIADRGEKIIFCEPSCLSVLKDDAPSLLRGEQQRKARVVARACQTFEEFVAALPLPLAPVSGRILLHGHCHQKSMGLLPHSLALLSRIPSEGVIDLDAGCCGMAGSFGYHRQHYEISYAIANRRLLPAVKNKNPGDAIVAAGFSCRHQIRDFTQAIAVHPAVFIRRLLTSQSDSR